MAGKFNWTFGINGTIDIAEQEEGKPYSTNVIYYWYSVDRKGRVTLKSCHNYRYLSPEEFKDVHRCLYEALDELHFMSRIK